MSPAGYTVVLVALLLLAIVAMFGWARWLELRQHHAELRYTLDEETGRADGAEARAAAAIKMADDTHRCLSFVLGQPTDQVTDQDTDQVTDQDTEAEASPPPAETTDADCPECGKSFASPKGLRTHQARMHKPSTAADALDERESGS